MPPDMRVTYMWGQSIRSSTDSPATSLHPDFLPPIRVRRSSMANCSSSSMAFILASLFAALAMTSESCLSDIGVISGWKRSMASSGVLSTGGGLCSCKLGGLNGSMDGVVALLSLLLTLLSMSSTRRFISMSNGKISGASCSTGAATVSSKVSFRGALSVSSSDSDNRILQCFPVGGLWCVPHLRHLYIRGIVCVYVVSSKTRKKKVNPNRESP